MATGLTDPARQIRRAVRPVLAALAGGTPNIGRDDVDDLESTVVEKVLRRLQADVHIVDIEAYAKQAARRAFYDLADQRGRIKIEALEQKPSGDWNRLVEAAIAVSSPPSPSAQVIAADDARRHAGVIAHALAQLSPAERCVLMLRFGDGLDGAQVAERMGYKSAAVVAVIAGRARAKLKAHLTPSLAGWVEGHGR